MVASTREVHATIEAIFTRGLSIRVCARARASRSGMRASSGVLRQFFEDDGSEGNSSSTWLPIIGWFRDLSLTLLLLFILHHPYEPEECAAQYILKQVLMVYHGTHLPGEGFCLFKR